VAAVACRDVWFAYGHDAPASVSATFAVASGWITASIWPHGSG
jgi:hypothetical protein